MENIFVTIIIPVYNSERWLSKCLDSIINQTYSQIEIICVNDNSTDDSSIVINEYMQKDDRIKCINHNENRNAGGARNSGIRMAKGEYVCFVDNDDWLANDAIEVMLSYSDNGNVDIIVPKWCQWYNESDNTVIQNLIIGASKQDNIRWTYKNGFRLLGCLFRRSIIVDNGFFFPEKIFWEDNAIGGLWINAANDIVAIDYVAYYYIIIEGSSSHLNTHTRVLDRIKSTDLFVANLRANNFYVKDKEYIDWKYLQLTHSTICMLCHHKYSDVKHIIDELSCKIKTYLPNRFFNDSPLIYRMFIEHPKLMYFVLNIRLWVKKYLRK